MFKREHRYSFSGKLPSQSIQSPFFVMRFEKTENPFTVAIVASKKLDKRSVVRNRAKRKLFHVLADQIPKDNTFSMVFYVRQPILAATTEDIQKEVDRVLGYAQKLDVRSR